MKHFVYFLIIAFCVAFTAEANAENKKSVQADRPSQEFLNSLTYIQQPVLDNKVNNTLATSPEYLATLDPTVHSKAIWGTTGSHSGNTMPISYDPFSKKLFVSYNFLIQNDANEVTGSKIEVWTLSDLGGSETKFTDTIVQNEEDMWLSNCGIAVLNPEGATDYDNIPFVLYGEVGIRDGDSYPYAGAYILNHKAGDVESDVFEGPEDNNPNSNIWGTMKLKALTTEESSFVYGFSKIRHVEDGYMVQDGYGFLAWDVENGAPFVSDAPSAIAQSQFKPNGGYNTNTQTDYDNEGNIYFAVNNNFDRDNPENVDRQPAVSKSTDNGETWSELNKMPFSLLSDYFTAKGSDSYGAWSNTPYGKDGFVVTGVDEYSYFFVYEYVTTEDNTSVRHRELFEAAYKNGTWTLNPITELGGAISLFNSCRKYSTTDKWIPTVFDNPRGHEIQVAKKTDGSEILLKWLAYRDEVYDIGTAEYSFIDRSGSEPDTVLTTVSQANSTDVFMMTKKIDSDDAEWSKIINVTNDTLFNKTTFIADKYEKTDSVPMISMVTSMGFYHDGNPALYAVNRYLFQQFDGMFQTPAYCYVNATGVTGVNDYKESYDFRINNIYPNPATANAEFTFTLEKSANVTVTLFDAMGREVAVLKNGFMSAGSHGMTINTNDYVSGSYIVTLEVAGRKVARSLNIVK